ncbi:MAG: LysM peptidoglycan-binding domain-containing protein [Nocardioides sp.]
MNDGRARGSWWRCVVVWLVTTAGAGGVLGWLSPDLHGAARLLGEGGPVSFETMLVSLAALTAAGCAAWCWLVTTLTVLEAATGPARLRVRGCPETWRRLVLTACGVALASGLLVPAEAADPTGPGRREAGVALVDGLALPDRPVTDRPVTARPATARPSTVRSGPAPARRQEQRLVVRPGDSLWSLAAVRLGGGATQSQVDAAWRRLYAANRAVVGPDPDLLHPGQRLRVPGHGVVQ